MYAENFDFDNLVTPVNVDVYEQLMIQANLDPTEIQFLTDGFRNGFSIGYEGPQQRRSFAPNHKLRVGTETDLWNKVMSEVLEKRYIGPLRLDQIPYDSFIQSPLTLVPKKGHENKFRLVFDLSYPRGDSLNSHTPEHLKKTKYYDLDHAIANSLKAGQGCFYNTSDFSAAFRRLPVRKDHWKWLVMKARDPISGITFFFIDKNLCFGSAVSCAVFQRFSNSIANIFQHRTKCLRPTNFLDDFLQVNFLESTSWSNLVAYQRLCEQIGFPLSEDKTTYPSQIVVFLGFLLNSITQTVSIPLEKRFKVLTQIDNLLRTKKTTVKYLQQVTGLLNFIGRAIVPGRAFTRRLYVKFKHPLKQYHHVRVDNEMRSDLRVWYTFLKSPDSVCRPFVDFSGSLVNTAVDTDLTSDASAAVDKGFACCYKGKWTQYFWADCGERFLDGIRTKEISINYLELFALAAGVILFGHNFTNRRVNVFCDNLGVVAMINNSTSSCKRCMVIIRIITLISLHHNCRIFAKWIKSEDNTLSDALSRGQFKRFWKHANPGTDEHKTELPRYVWPIPKEWVWAKSPTINFESIFRIQAKSQ